MEDKRYICEKCQAEFKHQSNYCRHKKKNTCEKPSNSAMENKLMQSEMEKIQLENKLLKFELQNIMPAEIEVKKGPKKKMKECDITFNEFTDSIELSFETINTISILGYIQGMTNIIIDKLDKLDDKPIYCTDTRRVIIYLMEESWVKNDKQMFEFIKEMDKKIFSIYNQWSIENPTHAINDSIEHELKRSFMMNMIENGNENKYKIIRNIAKYVQI
jgi:hypothetical protein